MPWYSNKTRQRFATLLTSTEAHKEGTSFRVSPAGEQNGRPVFHCYCEADKYVGLFSESQLKMKQR